jgi:hypothetical protein
MNVSNASRGPIYCITVFYRSASVRPLCQSASRVVCFMSAIATFLSFELGSAQTPSPVRFSDLLTGPL